MTTTNETFPEAPTVEELWSGAGDYYEHIVTFPSGNKFTVSRIMSGAFVGDYAISSPAGFYSDGHASADAAIAWLSDPERRDW